MAKRNTDKTKLLVNSIIGSISDKKGEDIVQIDLTTIGNAVCKYFIICHAESNVHIHSIADHIVVQARNDLKERVWKKEGLENSHWVLLDYSDVVVHIFKTEYRRFYNLEGLWADAKIDKIGYAV